LALIQSSTCEARINICVLSCKNASDDKTGGRPPLTKALECRSPQEECDDHARSATYLAFSAALMMQIVPGPETAQLLVFGATQKATGLVVLSTTALASGAVGDWLAAARASSSGKSGSPAPRL
jgi:hypothetical protein